MKRRSKRSADEHGDATDALVTGLRSQEHGDLRAAEEAYRRADERGDPGGAFNLGRLLVERGELAAAAVAFRRADKRGEPAAATNLGVLLEQQGDLPGAAAAYRRASERGHAAAAVNLGRLLARHDDVVGAEAAYRRASALGDDGALELLAGLVADRDEPIVAEAADRPAHGEFGRVPKVQPAPARPPREAMAKDARSTDGAGGRGRFANPWHRRRRRGDTTVSPDSKTLGVSSARPGDRRSSPPEQPTATSSPEKPDEPTTTPAPELATTPVTAGSTPEAPTSAPDEPAPTPAEVPGPHADEPARGRVQRVQALQRQLSWLGLEPGPVDGRYGPLTTGAVTRFQRAHGLAVDGVAGALTADALAATVPERAVSAPEPGTSDRVERVKALQRQLGVLGLDPGRVDGRYGPLTTSAVKRFQQAHDLHADGIADPRTQHALHRSLLQQSQD